VGCGDGYVLAVAQNVSLTSGSVQMFSDLQDAIPFHNHSSYLGDELFGGSLFSSCGVLPEEIKLCWFKLQCRTEASLPDDL
jgi:hypothetical protein